MLITEIILPVYNGLSILRDGLDAVLAYTPSRDSRPFVMHDTSDSVAIPRLSQPYLIASSLNMAAWFRPLRQARDTPAWVERMLATGVMA